ncbi:MAG: hypothetical protein LBF95_01535 [Treponema sp.]|nr:hypothetical protein [Treponema sp.]
MTLYLAVLVPHRDSRKVLRERSAELFAAGFWGAWSFPQVAPLALLHSPLPAAELGELARNLRALTLAGGRDGTLHPGAEAILPLAGLPEGAALYGPQLDPQPRPEVFTGAAAHLKELFPAPLVACAVLGPEDPREIPAARNPPARDFRAAAVANLSYRPIAAGGYSYAWRIGELHWLPKVRR